jgi:hypothetical protein
MLKETKLEIEELITKNSVSGGRNYIVGYVSCSSRYEGSEFHPSEMLRFKPYLMAKDDEEAKRFTIFLRNGYPGEIFAVKRAR